ncbi:hypothetical protein P3L10_029339 [Capsicum annuum]|uniref:uncharacterized protein LOC107844052 n=1 Tax=Capsicum annuum TaxID=4072 RepID=UPI0007BFB224|nr:uncharacterized protein LOC107844052 [Capsicum annuum]
MGIGLLEISVKMRKAVIFHIKVCYRTLWSHPFLVGMLCFLAFFYRSFPFAFSILVSISPVLVCTAALLGTLLSYGQPNIPELEWEENKTDRLVPLETKLSRDVTRVEVTERCSDLERDKIDQSTCSEVHRGKRFGDHSALVGGVFVGGISGLVARELYEKKNEEKISDAELMGNQYSPTSKVDDESVDFDNRKSVDSFDSRRVNLDSPPGSPWKRREEEYDRALYSGSDRAESSSPDASIADIMPMLDELHPLLDIDTPQPVGLSRDVSHAPSESYSRSSESDDESDDDSEDQEELEVADDENEDGEDEEETRDKEDPKSAITWTEEDQRNLMDLGTSELERNQRLESLIARRRSRKNMGFVEEKNLIDLVTADYMPPISTARQNPFDLPNDNYGPGLPPIPGSAPSVLLPRRNPFDLPYDPSEEKPDLTGDTFEQVIIPSQPKEPFFRRHESFSVGPSIFGLHRQERRDSRFRPYFVPDVMAAEGTSYSAFQRLPSDVSDSKVSSVLGTESQGSIEDLEDKNLTEEDVEDKNLSEELEGKNHTDEHFFKEPQLISEIEHASEDVGHGSASSEEVECLVLGASDKRDIELDDTTVKLANVENHHEVVPIVFHEENPSKIGSKSATSEQKYSSQSSSSSSEVSERIFTDKVVARLSSEDLMSHVETISEQRSPHGSDVNITSSSVDESSHVEPIYDASPPSIKKNTSSSSIASDVLLESGLGLAPEREPVGNNQDIEKSIPNKERIFSSADSQELRPREAVTDKNELGVAKLEISKHDEVSGGTSAPPVTVADSQASIDSKSSTKEAPVSVEEARTIESFNVSKIQEVPPSINAPRSPESVLKPANAKVATEKSESSKNGVVHKGSSLKGDEMRLPTPEPKPAGDIDLIQKCLPEENADRDIFHDSIGDDVHARGDIFHDSIGDDVHARESKDKGASLHSQNVGTDSALKQVLKNDIDKPNMSLQQESETESREASSSKSSESSLKKVVSERSEANAGKIDQKVVKQEDKATTTKKPDHAVGFPQETGGVTGDVIGKKENHTSPATTTKKPDHAVGLPQETVVVTGDVTGKKENNTSQATTTKKPDHAVGLPQETGVVTGDVIGKKENQTSQAQDQVRVTSKENEDS